MTKGLDKVFGLPSMEDILAETEETEEKELEVVQQPELPSIDHTFLDNEAAEEHGRAMDVIHDEMLQHAKDIAELAFDLDPARAPRMLEVGAMYYKGAMEAKNSKRDAQLKLLKLINDDRKLKLEEAKFAAERGELGSDKADVIMIEDRNALLKRLKEEASKSEDEKPK